jgi:hypothetical protein
MASARERKDAEDLLRRYPHMLQHLADIPAVREIKHERAARWVKSLGLNPAHHGLPTPKGK